MSKRSKAASKQFNRKQKKALKEAQRLRYASYRDSGQNTKSVRAKANAQKNKRKARNGRHLQGACTNIGCSKCFANFVGNDPWLASPGSFLYKKLFTSPKYRNR